MNRTASKLWDGITSLKLTITCLSALMILVVACTLAQVRLGTLGAVNLYMRSWFYWMDLGRISLPIFPGGATVGLVLMVNLVAAQGRRLELSWRKAGIWIVHAGLIFLFIGEFVTGGFQVDARLVFEEGQTANYVEVPREVELAIVDSTDPAFDDVYGVSERALGRGGTIAGPRHAAHAARPRVAAQRQLGQAPPGAPTAGATRARGSGSSSPRSRRSRPTTGSTSPSRSSRCSPAGAASGPGSRATRSISRSSSRWADGSTRSRCATGGSTCRTRSRSRTSSTTSTRGPRSRRTSRAWCGSRTRRAARTGTSSST